MELQIKLDRSRRVNLPIQIAHGIRDTIFSQQLPAGTKLPPSRELAQRLQVARMVVVEAYEWLVADGYAVTHPGSGTFVATKLLPVSPNNNLLNEPKRRTDLLPEAPLEVDFRPGLPALDLFPRQAWKISLSKALLRVETSQLGYGPVEGLPRLRRLIAGYAARTRGLPVAPEQVIITVGAAQAFDLLLRTLAPIQNVGIENPGSEPVYRLMHLGRIQALPIAVDENGMCVDRLPGLDKAPRLVYVMPSHQYPTGWTMSLERRMDLINWAEKNESYIIEDDYDSEFRFDRQPPIALAALDSLRRVIYVGTFSKTMFPGLRLGFCILPEKLIPGLLDLKWFSDRCVPVIEQLALADWLESGSFERHIRKMRSVYALRRQVLVKTLGEALGDRAKIQGVPAGVHSLVTLDLGLEESELVELGLKAGIKVYPAGACYLSGKSETPGVILGYGNLNPETIVKGVKKLANVWLGAMEK